MLNARELRTLTRTMEFASKSDFKNLEEHFHIPSVSKQGGIEMKMSIWMEPTTSIDEYILVIQRSEQSLCEAQGVPLEKIPEDVERIIYGFLKGSTTIRIRITLQYPFPHQPPYFKLVSSTKDAVPLYRIANRMNYDLLSCYSPALAVEKTVLILISRIFEGMGWV